MHHFLKKYGFVPVLSPTANLRPLDLLLNTSGGAERLNANIMDVFISSSVALPISVEDKILGDSIEMKQTSELNGKAKVGFLKYFSRFFLESNLDVSLNEDIDVAIEVQKPSIKSINIIQLDRYINSSKVLDGMSFIKEKLYNDEIYIVTSTVSVHNFSFHFGNNSGKKGRSGLGLNKVVDLEIEASQTAGKTEALEYTGDEPLVIGIKACKIFYSGSIFRKGVLAIKEGKISTVKNEQLPIAYLNSELTTDLYEQRSL